MVPPRKAPAAPPRKAPAARPAGPSPLDCLEATFVAEAREPGALPDPSLPEVAFAGRSNVGKSTLLNRLAQRKSLARTSRTPGCTRGVVLFQARLRDGTRFIVADLPGYGYASRSHGERMGWGGLIEGYLAGRPTLAGVAILVDARRGPEDEEYQLAEYLHHLGRPFLVVLTKADKVPKSALAALSSRIARETRAPLVVTSGETGAGREDLLAALVRLAGLSPQGPLQTESSGPPTPGA